MIANALGAEFRVVENRAHEGKAAVVMIATRIYATDIDDMWDALSNLERLPRWFTPIEGDLKLGGHYQLKGNAGGTITRCDPPRALDLTWECAGSTSWVTVRLEPAGERTRLTLEHIVPASEAAEHWTKFGPGATGVGWDLAFLGLGMHLASGGAPVDRAAVDHWYVSEDGKAFIRASAEAWGAAHIASGADAAVTRGMAERTAAAYMGG
jgi:uncharacterized protein YndB with AHSA1/START domain